MDGFKLDAGDTEFYKDSHLSHEKLDVNEHARLFGEIGLAFPLNEYRASWKLAGRPVVQIRLFYLRSICGFGGGG